MKWKCMSSNRDGIIMKVVTFQRSDFDGLIHMYVRDTSFFNFVVGEEYEFPTTPIGPLKPLVRDMTP